MPRYSRQQFARAIVQMMDKHPLKDVAKVAAAEIISQRWTKSLDLIVSDIASELFTAQKHLAITVYSARDLSSHLQKEIAQLLEKHSGATSSSVSTVIDPTLIGGFRAVSPAGEIDATVSTKLNQLKHSY